jgi:hypothetical protein
MGPPAPFTFDPTHSSEREVAGAKGYRRECMDESKAYHDVLRRRAQIAEHHSE